MENAVGQSEHLDQTPALTPTVRSSQCGHTVWGTMYTVYVLWNLTFGHGSPTRRLFQVTDMDPRRKIHAPACCFRFSNRFSPWVESWGEAENLFTDFGEWLLQAGSFFMVHWCHTHVKMEAGDFHFRCCWTSFSFLPPVFWTSDTFQRPNLIDCSVQVWVYQRICV